MAVVIAAGRKTPLPYRLDGCLIQRRDRFDYLNVRVNCATLIHDDSQHYFTFEAGEARGFRIVGKRRSD